jgi:virulence factor Mce-like protein
MAIMASFLIVVLGLLLFLWVSFGGSTPLRPQGYEFQADFPETTTLAQQADVRISGIRVGRVTAEERAGTRTRVTIEIDRRYAPIRSNARAILRQKTLLGETYVEIAPGTHAAPPLDDGGMLARGQVERAVHLDEIVRAFDPRTRAAFQRWLEDQGRVVGPRGAQLNAALAHFAPLTDDASVMFSILRDERRDVGRLIRGTGDVFDSLSARDDQLRSLVRSSDTVFAATASRDRSLQEAITVLPTFLRESRLTERSLTAFARDTQPLVTQLQPSAELLAPTLADLDALAPDLRALFVELGPFQSVALTGFPAIADVLDGLQPVLESAEPVLRDLGPIVDYLGPYRREIATFFANGSTAAQATEAPAPGARPLHYLRLTNPINLENLAAYPQRVTSNRTNPYVYPGGYSSYPLKVFGRYLCTNTPVPQLARLPIGGLTDDTLDLIQERVIDPALNTPPCTPQTPLGTLVGQTGVYPQVRAWQGRR